MQPAARPANLAKPHYQKSLTCATVSTAWPTRTATGSMAPDSSTATKAGAGGTGEGEHGKWSRAGKALHSTNCSEGSLHSSMHTNKHNSSGCKQQQCGRAQNLCLNMWPLPSHSLRRPSAPHRAGRRRALRRAAQPVADKIKSLPMCGRHPRPAATQSATAHVCIELQCSHVCSMVAGHAAAHGICAQRAQWVARNSMQRATSASADATKCQQDGGRRAHPS